MVIGFWVLVIGPNPQSPIPNPQSPIPNPHSFHFIKYDIDYKLIIFILKLILISFYFKLEFINI